MKKTRAPGAGRPRVNTPELPIYDSIGSCAGATGIPKHVLSKAKHAGCNGFRAGRIYLADVLPFLFAGEDGKDDSNVDWDRRFKKARALLEEFELEDRQSKMATKEYFGQLIFVLSQKQKAILETANLPAEQMSQICRLMQEVEKDFPKEGASE